MKKIIVGISGASGVIYGIRLLEVLKDIFYQCFVRRGKLTRAIKVRRFFVEERDNDIASSA